jgi:integrase
MTTQWQRLSEGEGADSDKPDVDCLSCPVRDAVLDFATQSYEALVRKAIVRLQWIKATGIYGDDYGHKTLWDEYCHEVQFGPLATLSDQVSQRVYKSTGLEITTHQFRHAAAAFYLKHHPGDYETVRRILGHRNIQTTINFYCGLETIQASDEFGKLIGRERGRAGGPDELDLTDAR